MEKIVVDIEVKSDKGVKEVQKLNNEIKETNKVTGEATKTLDGLTGGAVTKVKNFGQSIKGLTTGFKSLRVAIIGTGICALLIAVTSLMAAFKSSEEGQNKFAKILGVIGSVVGNLVDLLADLGEAIISVFENPKKAIIDFKNLIQENITNRFKALMNTIGFLGSAMKKVFSGDFKGALEDAKKSSNSLIDSLTGVENTLDKVTKKTKDFVKELKEEAKIAAQIADQRANADKAERNLLVQRAKANRDRADLLEKAANREKFTAKERIEFLKEAGKIDEEITNKEIAAAKLRLQAKQAENSLARSKKEDLDEEARLKARVIELETQRLTKQKEVTSQIVGAKREEAAQIKAIEDKKASDLERIRKGLIDTEEEERKEKLRLIKTDYDEQIKLAEEYYGKESEKVLELRKAQKTAIDNQQAEFDLADKEKEKAKIQELNDLKSQIRDAEAVTEEERRILELENTALHYDKLIELAKAKGLATEGLERAKENAINKLKDDNSKKDIDREKQLKQQKIALASSTFGAISQVLGENSKAGKAFALAQALINTYQGISNVWAEKAESGLVGAGLVQRLATTAIVASQGFATVKNIASVKTPSGGGGASVGVGSSPTIASAVPSFNVVGSSGTNQLAEAIGGQEKEPIKAYVVANDVTSAQSMERNIVEGASI